MAVYQKSVWIYNIIAQSVYIYIIHVYPRYITVYDVYVYIYIYIISRRSRLAVYVRIVFDV